MNSSGTIDHVATDHTTTPPSTARNARASQATLGSSSSGMKSRASSSIEPVAWRAIRRSSRVPLTRLNRFGSNWRHVNGRVNTTSGSRPTMIVSEWWRTCDQRHSVGSRSSMNEAR